jgi:hypothetical protein
LQAPRDKRLGRIADFLRLMTRAFKCSFSTAGKFEMSATKAVFVLIHGMPLLAMLQHETLPSALAPGLFVGDRAAIGA